MRDLQQSISELRSAMMRDDGHSMDPEDEAARENGSAWFRARRGMWRVRPWVWALPCAVVAVVYAVVWPASDVTAGTTATSYLILRWGHSATWVLLALSFVVRGSTSHWSSRIANLLAIAALLNYAAFLFTAA